MRLDIRAYKIAVAKDHIQRAVSLLRNHKLSYDEWREMRDVCVQASRTLSRQVATGVVIDE